MRTTPHPFKLNGIPGHLDLEVEFIQDRGVYFGQVNTYTPKTQAAGHILLLAVSDAFASHSVEEIAKMLDEVRTMAAQHDKKNVA